MVNALDFIDSRDIRKYWEEIKYKASALETAWLIWQSPEHTLQEEHEAYLLIS